MDGITIKIKGELEIDQERGVVYFHSAKTGHTPLRICGLPKHIPDPSKYGIGLDITHMHGCNWVKQEITEELLTEDENLDWDDGEWIHDPDMGARG